MQPHGLSKAQRVRRHGEFQHAFATGTRLHGRFVTLVVAGNSTGTTRLGIVASRRVGNAVERNRAKRLIREVFRQNAPAASRDAVDFVVIPRRGFFEADFAALEQDFRSALRRCTPRPPRHGR
jgi:ribonuclease P protein component